MQQVAAQLDRRAAVFLGRCTFTQLNCKNYAALQSAAINLQAINSHSHKQVSALSA
jgi:hypothetical protein